MHSGSVNMEKFLLNKIVELSGENGALRNENENLKKQLNKNTNKQPTELELRKRLINLKYKEI